MKFYHACREVGQLTWAVVGVFCLLALLFIGGYLYVDYRHYLSIYEVAQQSELQSVQEKASRNIENLKKLSVLTDKRIAVLSGNVQQIQNVLVSTPSLLPDRDFFKIQKVTYAKHSQPQSLITRFGTLPLEDENRSTSLGEDGAPSVLFDQEKAYSKTWIFNPNGKPEGVLEIHVALPHFKETLKIGSTLSFVPEARFSTLQKEPFPIYGMPPETFWGYVSQHIVHYTLFFLFFILSVVFIILNNLYSRFRIRKNIQEELEILQDELSEAQVDCEKANDNLLSAQKRIETHQMTCHAYKQFQASLSHHQKEQLDHVLRSLDVVMGSFKNPNIELPVKDIMDILMSCLGVIEDISNGALPQAKHESVNVKKILANVRALFTEKMYKSDLTLETHCPDQLTYYGDPLLLEFMLLNLIGKPLYMAPKNGKVEVKASDHKEDLQIQVKANGFAANPKSLHQIQQSFDLFISEDRFHQLCRENGFVYEFDEDKDGLNVTKLVFPKMREEMRESNVISFNKR